MLARRHSVTVLGDLFVEVSSHVQGTIFGALERDTLCYSGVRVEPGGTALNFAMAASQHFAQVNILGQVGNDAFGATLLGASMAENVRLFARKSEALPTGTT